MKLRIKLILLVFSALLFPVACGSDGSDPDEEIQYDQKTAEGAAQLVWNAIRDGSLWNECDENLKTNDLYITGDRLSLYYSEDTLGMPYWKVCHSMLDDLVPYEPKIGSPMPGSYVVVDNEGRMPNTSGGVEFPYKEVTVYSENDDPLVHVLRMVEHDGRWHVLILNSYLPNLF